MKKFTLVAFTFLLLFLSNDAFGCGCPSGSNPTPESIRIERQKDFDDATAVFSGEVIKSDVFKAEFKIDKIWKGDFDEKITTLTATKDNGDGIYTTSGCDYQVKLGEKYLIYAYGKTDELKTRSCSRSRLLVNAIEKIEGLEKIVPHKDMNKLP